MGFCRVWPAVYWTGYKRRRGCGRRLGFWGLPGWWGSGLSSCWRTIHGLKLAWLAASDRSSGKPYGEAVRWKLDTALPERMAAMPVSPATPEGAPRVIFAALDADIARELEPRFAAAGCAVITNSSAFRMEPSVPLVIPEVNAEHLALVENQTWRRGVGRVYRDESELLGDWAGDGAEAAGGAVWGRGDFCKHDAGGERRGVSGRGVAGHPGECGAVHQE